MTSATGHGGRSWPAVVTRRCSQVATRDTEIQLAAQVVSCLSDFGVHLLMN